MPVLIRLGIIIENLFNLSACYNVAGFSKAGVQITASISDVLEYNAGLTEPKLLK